MIENISFGICYELPSSLSMPYHLVIRLLTSDMLSYHEIESTYMIFVIKQSS